MDHWLSITNGVAVGSVNKYPPGRFYHVAGVVNKEAGTTTIYVNGKRDGVTKWPANSPTKDYGTIRWRIGHGNPDGVNWTWPAKGVIDEVRIYGRALSEIEISGLAGTGPLAGAKEFRGHYYKYFDKRVTWHKARDLCKEIGGHLVTINSPEENAFVENLIPSMGIWLGLTDEDTEGKWDTWITGEPVTYKNWDPSQPNGVTPGQDYAATHENKAHRWFDNEARNSRMFVCEWGTETGSSGTSQPRGNPSTEGINLLKHVKLPGAIVNGGWSNLDGALAANGTFAVLELPYEPGEEYDFRVRFSMKKAGRKKYQVAQIFSHNGKQYCWSTMHYDGTGTVSGFSGGTPKAANRTHPPLENDRIYTTTIKIRKNRVLAYRNGKLLVSYTTDYNDLSTDPKLKVRNPKLLGIGSNMAQTTFHSVEVVEKTGKGKLIEGSVIPVAGAGGLTGEYFNLGKGKFEGKPTFTRIDPEIDFQWHDGSPDPRIIPESFTVRWSGRIRAPTTDTYTFITKTDDGVRLWVDGKLVIDHWASAFTASGAIHLRGGKLYDIKMEYCEHGGGAQAHLSWKTPSIKTQIIPRNVLYPAPQNEREKTKIPSSSKRMALLREIKRQYKLPRTTTARRELAKELIKKADAIEGNSDERYALLQHAKEVSASTADLGAAFAAAEQLASYYQINVLEEKKSAIEKARSVPRIPEVARSFVRSCMGFMDECVEADDYKLAKYALSNASRLSKVAQDKPLSDRVKEASKTVVLLERAYSRINRYLEKVKSTPKDPKANLEVAKYYAFQKQDWEKGTAHLALAVGTDYEEVGKVEANKPVTYEDVRLAGTAWNKLQSKLRGSDKEGAKQRAIHWYYKARELAPENERSRWEEGISKLQGAQQLPRNGLVFWIEPGRGKTPYAEVLTNLTPKINQKPVTSGNPVPPSFELTEVWYPRSAKVKGVGPDGTVVVWVKTDVKDRNQALVERGPGYLQDFLLRVGNNNKFVAQIKTPPSFTSLFSKRTVVPGEWVCGMMTWNARELSVYADGVKEGTKPLNGPSVFDQDIIRLGKSTFDDGFLKGQIGLVLVYDRQVTDKEAWAIYDLYRKRFR